MSLDVNALAGWIVVSIAFMVIVAALYTKVSRVRAKTKKTDESKDEAPAY